MNLFKKYSFFDILTHTYYIVRYEKINRIYSTIIFQIKSKLLQIKIGKNCSIFGKINIIKFPSSKILLGSNCNLISCAMKSGASTLQEVRLKTFSPTASIIIEDNVDLNGTSIACRSKTIHIKKNTMIGPNVIISDSDFHCIEPKFRMPNQKKACFEMDKDIIIEENVWIGMNTVILKGVKIGKNSIVGAGSIVTKDIDENSIYAGNPARKIRNI
jgi:acetyltransferase-like isoleucine patch superfamily enzyme